MATLRDIWTERSLSSTEVAAKAGISVPTLYRMNRKEPVFRKHLIAVCRVLGISLKDYASLEVCPQAERYKPKEEEPE